MQTESRFATWMVGDVRITKVVEMEVPGGTRFILPDATPEECLPISWLQPHFMTDTGRLIMSIHAFILEVGGKRIIVDTCLGNDKERALPGWHKLQTSFLKDLEEAGFAPDSIDTVLCTHLHVDHVGWNTILKDGKWVPTFPNARYLIAEQEFNYWRDEGEYEHFGDYFDDSVRPVYEAGLIDLVAMDHRICDEVRLEPTPGHSIGHVSIAIGSKGAKALITGDFMHHPCQIARPHWCSSADYDSAQGFETRRNMLARLADEDTLVLGTHFAGPSCGYIVKDGEEYRLDVPSD